MTDFLYSVTTETHHCDKLSVGQNGLRNPANESMGEWSPGSSREESPSSSKAHRHSHYPCKRLDTVEGINVVSPLSEVCSLGSSLERLPESYRSFDDSPRKGV